MRLKAQSNIVMSIKSFDNLFRSYMRPPKVYAKLKLQIFKNREEEGYVVTRYLFFNFIKVRLHFKKLFSFRFAWLFPHRKTNPFFFSMA